MRHTIANERKTKAGLGSKINNFDQTKIAHRHFLAGDISNKIPVPLSDGRTVVFANQQRT